MTTTPLKTTAEIRAQLTRLEEMIRTSCGHEVLRRYEGEYCMLPFHGYDCDFEPEVTLSVLVVNGDVPEAGYLRAESMEEHYRKLFHLGYSEPDEDGYDDF
jgi:hypothetical protein